MVLNLTVKVHPVVLFQIVNAYERRNLDRTSILGTLLGKSTLVNICSVQIYVIQIVSSLNRQVRLTRTVLK